MLTQRDPRAYYSQRSRRLKDGGSPQIYSVIRNLTKIVKSAWEPEFAEVLKLMIEQRDELSKELAKLKKTIDGLDSESHRIENSHLSCSEYLNFGMHTIISFFSSSRLEISSEKEVKFKIQVVKVSQNPSIISAHMLNLLVPIIFQVEFISDIVD